jgi:hypothetical protein
MELREHVVRRANAAQGPETSLGAVGTFSPQRLCRRAGAREDECKAQKLQIAGLLRGGDLDERTVTLPRGPQESGHRRAEPLSSILHGSGKQQLLPRTKEPATLWTGFKRRFLAVTENHFEVATTNEKRCCCAGIGVRIRFNCVRRAPQLSRVRNYGVFRMPTQ